MGNSIVFVDGRVADIGLPIPGLAPGTAVGFADGAPDGLYQLTVGLRRLSAIDAIRIISHCSADPFTLGASTLWREQSIRLPSVAAVKQPAVIADLSTIKE